MKKNDRFICTCEAVSDEGFGIVKPEGFVIFVRGLWKNDTAEIIVTRTEKNYGFGKILQLINPSSARTEPGCSVYPRCGGCSIRHVDYQEELSWKEEKVRNCIRSSIGLDGEFLPIVPSPKEERYRNKLQAPVTYRDGKLCWGFYRIHSHDLIPVTDCKIEDKYAVKLMNELTECLSGESVGPFLRHILIRHGIATGEYMIVVVSRKKDLPGFAEAIRVFRESHPEVVSVILNINPEETNVILGKEDILITGKDTVEDRLGILRFEISAHSFYQVNPVQCVNLYNAAKEFAGLTGKETVLDLYCGTGTIGLWMANQAKEVIGIEIVPSAVRNAEKNAKHNGIENASFICEDAAKGAELLNRKQKHADVVLVDPPRKGMDEKARRNAVCFNPDRIVYISCNPVTLARDLAWFRDNGYRTEKIQPYDMFARTSHVETVVLMTKK